MKKDDSGRVSTATLAQVSAECNLFLLDFRLAFTILSLCLKLLMVITAPWQVGVPYLFACPCHLYT